MGTPVEWFYNKIKSNFEKDGDLMEKIIFTMAIAKQKERENKEKDELKELIAEVRKEVEDIKVELRKLL